MGGRGARLHAYEAGREWLVKSGLERRDKKLEEMEDEKEAVVESG